MAAVRRVTRRRPPQPFNPTDKVARALIARTDPNEQESVVLI